MMDKIKALTFDTGGTILDWHTGFRKALESAGKKYDLDRSWATITNELRRQSMGKMVGLGQDAHPRHNFDDAHGSTLSELIEKHQLNQFTDVDRKYIALQAPRQFKAWPDVASNIERLKKQFMVCSFTLLSYRMIIETAKNNGISWDSVFSCEGLGKYKTLPESYEMVARFLQLSPEECCMVACHPFDLKAARNVGFRTAYVHRPNEWGPNEPALEYQDFDFDIVAEDIDDLVSQLRRSRS